MGAGGSGGTGADGARGSLGPRAEVASAGARLHPPPAGPGRGVRGDTIIARRGNHMATVRNIIIVFVLGGYALLWLADKLMDAVAGVLR